MFIIIKMFMLVETHARRHTNTLRGVWAIMTGSKKTPRWLYILLSFSYKAISQQPIFSSFSCLILLFLFGGWSQCCFLRQQWLCGQTPRELVTVSVLSSPPWQPKRKIIGFTFVLNRFQIDILRLILSAIWEFLFSPPLLLKALWIDVVLLCIPCQTPLSANFQPRSFRFWRPQQTKSSPRTWPFASR